MGPGRRTRSRHTYLGQCASAYCPLRRGREGVVHDAGEARHEREGDVSEDEGIVEAGD